MPTREDLMKYDLDELVIVIICKEAGLKHTSNDEAAKRFTKWDGFRIARNTLAHDLIMTDEFKQSMLVGNEDYVDVICKDQCAVMTLTKRLGSRYIICSGGIK